MSDTPSSPGPAPATFRAGAGSPLPPPVPGTGPAGAGATGAGAAAGAGAAGAVRPAAGPAPATPPSARSHPLPPPGNRPPEDAPPDDDGFRPPLWVFIVVPVLIVALAALLIWRNATDTGPGSSPVVSDTTVFSTVPSPTVTTPGGEPGTTGGTSAPSATTAPSLATTVPIPSTAPAPTTASAPTTVATPSTAPPPPTTRPTRALVVAQQVASALADGNWAAVRRLSPTDQRTNAQFEKDYAGLDRSTVVPARQTPLSSGLVDLRVGLVAHESRTSGPQTSLFCAHWIVDPVTSTVQRLDGALVRTMGGTIPPSQVSAELATTCATMALR